MTKRTYQPSKRRRSRKHGFRARAKQGTVLARRRKKQRSRLAPTS